MKSGLVDIECHLHHETQPASENEGAFLVSLDGKRGNAVWVPKSCAEIENKGRGVFILTISEDLATDKGLV
jgi:hypothetical protein